MRTDGHLISSMYLFIVAFLLRKQNRIICISNIQLSFQNK